MPKREKTGGRKAGPPTVPVAIAVTGPELEALLGIARERGLLYAGVPSAARAVATIVREHLAGRAATPRPGGGARPGP